MIPDVDKSVAWAMETDVRLLPVLPDLLADLSELGPSAEQIVSALDSVDLKPESLVLDLGCGKGPVAVALAERLGLRVEGIDAFAPFLRTAQALAKERGVGSRCSFRKRDIRDLLGKEAKYDAVLLLSVGPVAGDYERTVAGIRTLVRPGGYIVIEDGYLADPNPELSGSGDYTDRREMLRRLTVFGDRIVLEVQSSFQGTRAVNEKNTGLIRHRAEMVKADRPDLSELIDEYVARQEHETRVLGTDVICAVWVLERI